MLDAVDVLLASPIREVGCMLRVRRASRLWLELSVRYLWRFPAIFVYRDRRSLGAWNLEDDSWLFGETPLDTAETICRRVGLQAEDVLLDAGCGRGKMVFFAHLWSGCRAVGIDALPTYIRVARRIQRSMRLRDVEFHVRSFAHLDLCETTVLYVHGPNFSDAVWQSLTSHLDDLPSGARCVIVGRICEHPRLSLTDELPATFSWGRSVVRFYAVV